MADAAELERARREKAVATSRTAAMAKRVQVPARDAKKAAGKQKRKKQAKAAGLSGRWGIEHPRAKPLPSGFIKRELILQAVARGDQRGATRAEIVEATGLERFKVRYTVRELTEEGFLKKSEPEPVLLNEGDWRERTLMQFRFTLTQKGRARLVHLARRLAGKRES